MALSVLLQLAVIYVPVLQRAFDTIPLRVSDWLTCVLVASSVLWLRKLSKALRRGLTRFRIGRGHPSKLAQGNTAQ